MREGTDRAPLRPVMELLFWILGGALAWCYVGYPGVMRLRAGLSKRASGRDTGGETGAQIAGKEAPSVSVVLAVRNEAERIEGRLENILAQRYPRDRLEIIVVCNGCSDGTEERTWEFVRRETGVRLLGSPAKEGKSGALNRGVAAARGNVVVFADARQRFRPDAVSRLVAAFDREEIGAVSGRLLVKEPGEETSLKGVRRYWAYETRLRMAESETGSVVGTTGAIYAIRREVFTEMPPGLILDDVYLPLNVAQKGYRVVLAPGAVAVDVPAENQRAEFTRRLRTAVGNIQLLRTMPELLVPWRNRLFGRYLSHKLLRIVSPLLVTGTMVLGFLLGGMFYQGLAAVEAALLLSGVVGLVVPSGILSLPAAFVLEHVALVHALIRPNLGVEALWSSGAQR